MEQEVTLEELLRMKVGKIEYSPEFRIEVQNLDTIINGVKGVHVIIHAYGFNSDTLDLFVSGNQANVVKDAEIKMETKTMEQEAQDQMVEESFNLLAEEAQDQMVEESFINFFNSISASVHNNAVEKGWWEEEDYLERLSQGNPELLRIFKELRNAKSIALKHAELSEVLESLRDGEAESEKIPGFLETEEEYADVIIRIMDHATRRGLRIAEAIVAKMKYNKTRPYKHGKLF